jgi:TonB family protein
MPPTLNFRVGKEGGVVVVTCVVDVKGQPKQVAVSRSLSRAFDKSAVHAVKQYGLNPLCSRALWARLSEY